MDAFDVKIDQKGDIYIMRMFGEINRNTLPHYREYVDKLMEEMKVSEKKNLKFICDYAGITDVDSSAVANVQDRLENAVRDDHKVVFINVPERFQHLVDILNAQETVVIYSSEEEAIKALQ